jgi:hypothetical protein
MKAEEKMKAFLIDPRAQSITEVEHDDSLENIYELIQATLFDVVRINNAGDVIYVDDEGLFRDGCFFMVEGIPSPIAGNGLVLGTDHQGRTVAPTLESVESLEDKVRFITLGQALEIAEQLDAEAMANQREGFMYISIAPLIRSRLANS